MRGRRRAQLHLVGTVAAVTQLDMLDIRMLEDLCERTGGPVSRALVRDGRFAPNDAAVTAWRRVTARSVGALTEELEGFVEDQVAKLAVELTEMAGHEWRSEALVRAAAIAWCRLEALLGTPPWDRGDVMVDASRSVAGIMAEGFPAPGGVGGLYDQDATR